ncbi:MAG: hypothetical protein H7A41_01035 [Chlamydiales bacterium]|nr:hypothetical protein [Chlamydiales bacterium]
MFSQSPVSIERPRGVSYLDFDQEEEEMPDLSHVSRYRLPPQAFLRHEPPPSLVGRTATPFDLDVDEEAIHHVGTYALGMSREEAEEHVDRIEEVGSYALFPDRREFNPEDYLTQGKAPLWFSSQMGGGGIGRTVDMTKEVDGDAKDKKPEADVERQQQFDMAFARMKFELGLGKDDVVNYDIARHSMVIYDREGNVKGKYDLKNLGLKEDPDHPIQGGGGLKQLLRDFGKVYTDEQIRELSDKLQGLNGEMKKIIEPETGGRLAYVFEAGNKGNIQGLVPFIARGDEARKVLHEDDQRGFFVKTMQRLGLVDTDSKTWPRSDVHTLTDAGAAALEDIEKAVALQNIILRNIEQKKGELKQRIQDLTPAHPAVPNEQEQGQIDALKKEIQQLNRVEDEIAGLSSSVSGRIRYLNARIQQLTPAVGVPSKAAKKEIAALTKEIKKLTSENRRTDGANSTVLHLMLMHLNSPVEIPHRQIRSADGRLIQTSTTRPAKAFLSEMPEASRTHFGVDPRDTHGADVVRNNLVDGVAQSVATGFETTVQEEHSSRKRRDWFKSTPMDLDPSKPAHKEIQQIGTNMGALVHDLAARTSTDPSDTRKARFIEGRSESGFARESRGLELLVAAAIFDGDTDIRGYGRESETVRGVMETSLAQFRAGIPHFQRAFETGAKLDEATKAFLGAESRTRRAATAA